MLAGILAIANASVKAFEPPLGSGNRMEAKANMPEKKGMVPNAIEWIRRPRKPIASPPRCDGQAAVGTRLRMSRGNE